MEWNAAQLINLGLAGCIISSCQPLIPSSAIKRPSIRTAAHLANHNATEYDATNGGISRSETSKALAGGTVPFLGLNVRDFGAKGDGIHDDTTAIVRALSSAGDQEQTIFFPPGRFLLRDSLRILKGINLRFERGARLVLDDGVVLSHEGSVEAGPWQIFSCKETAKVERLPGAENVYPQWWGAQGDFITNGAINAAPTDNRDAFQRAVNASRTVLVPEGNYFFSAPVVLPRYGKVTAVTRRFTRLIGQTSIFRQNLSASAIIINGFSFDSLSKGVAIEAQVDLANPDATGLKFFDCTFGNSLAYALNGDFQDSEFDKCVFLSPIYIVAGNMQTFRDCSFLNMDAVNRKANIAGIEVGSPQGAFFPVPALRMDEGHSLIVENCWFEHHPDSAVFIGPKVIGASIRDSYFERVANHQASTAMPGKGWYIFADDALGSLSSLLVSGNSFIGNVGKDADGVAFSPDTLGVLGGSGAKKASVIGNQATFWEKAINPAFEFTQFKPVIASGNALGAFSNDNGRFGINIKDALGLTGTFQAKNSGGQTFASKTAEKANCASETFDTEGWYDTLSRRYKPQKPGYYKLRGNIWVDQVAAGERIFLMLYKNGTLHRFLAREQNGSGSPMDVFAMGEALVYANGRSDFFELWIRNDDTVARPLFPDANSLIFEGEFVGYP